MDPSEVTPDAVLSRGIRERRYAGAAAQVRIGAEVVHRAVLGDALRVGDDHLPLWRQAAFDIASLTKVVGTTAALMALVTEGRLRVDDCLDRYLPSPHPDITLSGSRSTSGPRGGRPRRRSSRRCRCAIPSTGRGTTPTSA